MEFTQRELQLLSEALDREIRYRILGKGIMSAEVAELETLADRIVANQEAEQDED